MEQWIKTTGTIVYEPDRGGDFKKHYKTKTMVINLRHDHLGHLYRHMLKQAYPWLDLDPPMFQMHVTVVKGTEKFDRRFAHLWKRYEGRQIDVFYNTELSEEFGFWSLPVKDTDELLKLRHELGLYSFHNFHITVGRMTTQGVHLNSLRQALVGVQLKHENPLSWKQKQISLNKDLS